jgi:hypothetical protein
LIRERKAENDRRGKQAGGSTDVSGSCEQSVCGGRRGRETTDGEIGEVWISEYGIHQVLE